MRSSEALGTSSSWCSPLWLAGFWAEIALDGTMLYDAEFRVSKHLNQVRREIVAGLITRKVVHGQPYWVHTEVA